MNRDMTRLVRKATSQHGLLSNQQLRDLGVSRDVQRTMVSNGTLLPVRRGVVRLVGSPVTWHQRLLGAILAPGAAMVGSHRSALRLWGLFQASDQPEVSVAYPANRRVPGVTVHRSKDLQPEDLTVRDGIPITCIERTLCDAGAVFGDRMVQRFIDHAVANNLTSSARLMAFRRRVGEHGRTGVVRLEAAVERLAPDAPNAESGPEVDLGRVLVEAGLPEPVFQFTVTLKQATYRFDLAYPERRIALEYDGIDAHTRVDHFQKDRRRQNNVVAAGWTMLRFTHADLRDRPRDLVDQVGILLRNLPIAVDL